MFNIYFGQAAAAAHKHDFATAIELTEKGLRAGPGVTWAYRMLANFHGRAGDKQKSAEALAQFMNYYPGVTMAKMLQGLPPGVVLNDPEYWEGIRKAGIPES
jgi:adenylate cyclase